MKRASPFNYATDRSSECQVEAAEHINLKSGRGNLWPLPSQLKFSNIPGQKYERAAFARSRVNHHLRKSEAYLDHRSERT